VKNPNYPIGNRSHDHPTCSAVPQTSFEISRHVFVTNDGGSHLLNTDRAMCFSLVWNVRNLSSSWLQQVTKIYWLDSHMKVQ